MKLSEQKLHKLLSESWDLYINSERHIKRDAKDAAIHDWLETLYKNCQKGYDILSILIEIGLGNEFGIKAVDFENDWFNTWRKAAIFVNEKERWFKNKGKLFVIVKKLIVEDKDKSYEENLDKITNSRLSFLRSNRNLIKRMYQVVFEKISNLDNKTHLESKLFLIQQRLTEIRYYILRNVTAEGPCTFSFYMALFNDIEVPETNKFKNLTIGKTIENIYFKFDGKEFNRSYHPRDLELPFEIWDYNNGYYLHKSNIEEKAFWNISKKDAEELSSYQDSIKKLFLAITNYQKITNVYERLREKILIFPNKPMRVVWSYIKDLDEMIEEITGKHVVTYPKKMPHGRKWKKPKGYIGSKTIVNDHGIPRSTLQAWEQRDKVEGMLKKTKRDPRTKEVYYPRKWLDKKLENYTPRNIQT